jgi:predicted hotdog family 3-hydroxylacyl-ACP dehydratase
MKIDLSLPIAAEKLIPHREPIRVIDRLTGFDGKEGTVKAFIPLQSIFAGEDGAIENILMVELIAQSFAAVKGYADLLEGKPVAKGFLVEAKRCAFMGRAYEGDRLTVVIERVGETEEFAIGEGTIFREGELIGSGRVMVWIPRET